MTLQRMAGNASFSLLEPRVTHSTPTATQIGECVCNGCGSPFRAEPILAKAVQCPLPTASLHSSAANKTISHYGA